MSKSAYGFLAYGPDYVRGARTRHLHRIHLLKNGAPAALSAPRPMTA